MSWILKIRAGIVLGVVLVMPAVADEECGKAFTDVFREVSPSVVHVCALAIDPFSVVHRVQHGVGTGFVADWQGHIVTEFLPELIEKGRVARAWHGINGRIVPLQFVFAFGIPPGDMRRFHENRHQQ
jgi:S1-C subfamily serine protease